MKELKEIIGNNITFLRQKNKLTQSALGEMLNYSDKAVSKWEHAETTPSIEVLKELSKIFGVSIDFFTEDNIESYDKKYNVKQNTTNKIFITLLVILFVWLTATVTFVSSIIKEENNPWLIFILAVPLSSILLLIFNFIWGKKKWTFYIISAIIWTLLATIFIIYLVTSSHNLWIIFLIGIPLQLAVLLWSKLKRS